MSRVRNNPLLWLAAGLAITITVPLLLTGALRDPQVEAHRRALQQMPEAQRQRVETSYEEFRELPAAEQEQLRRLHAAVENSAELQTTLDKYRAWSNSLSPWQRLELRGEPDPAERLKLVQAAREEQERKRREDQENLERAGRFFAIQNDRFNEGAIRLDSRELRRMMERIAESLPESVQKEAAPEPPETADEYLTLLRAALTYHLENSDERWPDPELMAALIEGFDEDHDKERVWFQAVAAKGNGQPNLLQSLKYAVDHVWWGAAFWRGRHRRDETEEFYAALEPPQREELQQLSPEERDRALRRLMFDDYVEKHRGKFAVLLADVEALITRMALRGGFERLPEEWRPKPFDPERPPPGPPRRGDHGRERRGGDGPPRPTA